MFAHKVRGPLSVLQDGLKVEEPPVNLIDYAFSVACPNIWNPLPPHIKSSTTLGISKSNLKTYLFSLVFNNL